MAALAKSIAEDEANASELAFMAKIVDDASMSNALYAMARVHRVRALKLQGQFAALKAEDRQSPIA